MSGPVNIDCTGYIGFITRQMPSAVSTEESVTYMVSGCHGVDFPVGRYVVVEDGDTRYLARIVQSRIEDIYSVAKAPIISIEQELSMDIAYIPRFIALELVAECRGGSCGPAVTPPRIHALARWPRDGEVSEMLSLPKDGVELGYLATPPNMVLRGDVVKLPLNALRHHVLVVGTTGSGKTQLLKNIALELARLGNVTVLAMDAVGHYHHLTMDGVETRVILPISQRQLEHMLRGASGDVAKVFARRLARRYVREFYVNYGLRIVGGLSLRIRGLRSRRGQRYIVREVSVKAKVNDRDVSFTLIPWALESRDVLYRINDITGLLTEQARLFYPRVINEAVKKIGGDVTFRGIYSHLINASDVVDRGRRLLNYEVIANNLGLHTGTMENIVRAILSLVETGLFDVSHTANGAEVLVREPRYGSLFKPGYVVVDLRGTSSLRQRIVVYRILNSLFNYMRGRGAMAVVLVDEAHLFFPQTRADEERRIIENQLTRIARLGRSRGISVVFATHMPDDLNDAVLQLTNTKIILRSDEKVLERLGVPAGERRFLTVADAGVAYVRSFALKYPVYIRFEPKAYHLG